jgi:hypothetical protein
MRPSISGTAFAFHWSVSQLTPVGDVRDLIHTLKPIDCGRPLVRIGGERDGGYLLPDDLDGIAYCFSPGVGNLSDFESHLARLNIRSFLADYSVERMPVEKPEFTFDKRFIGANNTATSLTLEAWIGKYLPGSESDLLLQMDIEGSEYEVILSAQEDLLRRFRIMVIEFHFLDRIFDPFAYRIFKACFEKLTRHFYVAHIHPNNWRGSVKKDDLEVPEVMEFTFYNKQRAAQAKSRSDFPHILDRENASDRRALKLPKCWYS